MRSNFVVDPSQQDFVIHFVMFIEVVMARIRITSVMQSEVDL
jgi:hypothetical protein